MKVLVGLSGGVDSAVAAYLLKQEGYDVSCCFMRNWDSALNNDTLGNPTLNDPVCPQEKDYNDALNTADALGLKLDRIDYIEEYWNDVFVNFLDEYKKGRTPNPDILCNKYIKFNSFLNYSKEKGYDYIATGHYFLKEEINQEYRYFKAFDTNKDQSYFLAQVDAKALASSLFPLGKYNKKEIRRIAHELALPIAEKKDSTGVCFIGERNFREFLKNYIPMKEGDIVDLKTKEVIGKHNGVYYYTIGQRKGFAVGGKNGPYYCCYKDVEKNILYLAPNSERQYLVSDQALIGNINWLRKPPAGLLKVKFRYRQADQDVYLSYLDDGCVLLEYPQGIEAVAPGQQAVFYLNNELLGGGVIEETYYKGKNRAEHLKEIIYG